MKRSSRQILDRFEALLDAALAGDFTVTSFEEGQLSKIESKMARFLQLHQLKAQRAETERAQVRSLIGDISHQTKTPLANIALYAQLLAEQELTEVQAEMVAQIGASTEKLDFLIQSLVKTSRLESGAVAIMPQPFDVETLITAAVREASSAAVAKNITVSVNPPDEMAPHRSAHQDPHLDSAHCDTTHCDSAHCDSAHCDSSQHRLRRGISASLQVMADPRWVTEALFNVIDNAVKYTPPGGQVNISAVEMETFVRLDVIDSGIGIAAADIPKIFRRFWRAPTSADKPGVGIGLYLARQIITVCGGYLKVTSTPGLGSTFSLFLAKPPH
jgi:signal transduction histidine kinase